MADNLLSIKHMSKKWNTEIPWQKDTNYILRCTDETFGPSKSSGKPMITLKFEVVSPEEMDVNGEPVNIAGVNFNLVQYFVTQSVDENGVVDLQKTANIKTRLEKLYNAFGLPSENINPENPTLGFKGKTVYCWLDNKASEQRKSPTAAQLAAGQKQGDILVNPVTKKPLMINMPEIKEIFGLAPETAGAPY